MLKSFIIVFFLLLAGCVAPGPSGRNLVAHKGGNEVAAENTLPAFEAALREKFSLECDVRLAADGSIYLSHDALKDPSSATRLEDLLAKIGPGDELQLDCKCERQGIDPVIAAVRTSGAHRRGRILWALRDAANGRKVKRELPECDVWVPMVLKAKPGPKDPDQTPAGIAQRVRDADACGISLKWNEKLCTEAFFAELNRLGVEIDVWTVDDSDVAAEAIRRGARWVTTNKPFLLKGAFRILAHCEDP